MENPSYTFEKYDVLEILNNGQWLSFSTLRTAEEGRFAMLYVNGRLFEGKLHKFRIIGMSGNVKVPPRN